MFTGLVERTGRVVSLTASHPDAGVMSQITQLIVDAGKNFDTTPGDSVSVNGCCLTVTSNKVQFLAFDVSRETLAKTSLGSLTEGAEVNLERALRLGDRLGGHLVTGHVDGTGTVVRVGKQPDGWDIEVRVPRDLARYCIHKGSICLDGVSLTINRLQDESDYSVVSLMLIPTTVSLTSLKSLREGYTVNIEVDSVGKFVERLTGPYRRD